MAQIFHSSTNTLSKVSIFGGLGLIAVCAWLFGVFLRAPYVTQAGVVKDQPVPFSHKRHVAQLGLDCRYCHTSVEDSSFAGIPPTKTCMTCHSQIWLDSPMLEPVRESYRSDQPIPWTRVNDLPGFVHFDHSIHVAKGVGCVTCHGQVDEMPLMWRETALHMEWCLGCHRNPEPFLRPRSAVFDPGWEPAAAEPSVPPASPGDAPALRNDLLSCSTCHQ
jgi:hypothetical protein